MHKRNKTVELGGNKFQIRRLPTEMGSFIFMRMLGVSMRASALAAEERQSKPVKKIVEPTEPTVEQTKPDGEAQVRALSFSVFSGGMGYDDFKFIQAGCMKCTSIVEVREGIEFPMPIMDDVGNWTSSGESISDDVGLIMRLTTEVLIFCFSDFFDGSGLGL